MTPTMNDSRSIPTAPGLPPAVDLTGVTLHPVTEAQCCGHVIAELNAGRGGVIVTHNLDHLRRLRRDETFARICADASLRVVDGMPLVWACRLQGTPVPERVAGSNLVLSLADAAATAGRTVYLLGGNPGTAEAAGRALETRYPGLRIAGSFCPPPGFESDPDLEAAMLKRLADAAPDIVYVALGSPKQEAFIHRHRAVLPDAWWLGVGISFSFLAGDVRRAPRWAQRVGLEWAHRLAQEPRRLARRYLVDGIPFAARLLAGAGWRRLTVRPARMEVSG